MIFRIPCLFHALTGLYCPGCGGTRAVKYLLQGQILTSIQYHPLVFYMAVVITVELLTWIAAKLCGSPRLFLGHGNLFIYLGIAVTAVNWILKNVLLIIFGIDLLSVPLL
ncbi:MAG: DUF2752 domain-containing protein [Brotaphodocola sp.]